MRWILDGPALTVFANDPAVRRFLTASRPFVIRRRSNPISIPAAWGAVDVRTYTSCAHIERAIATSAIDPEAAAVLYDNEGWTFTPHVEQLDVAGFTRRAARIVRASGRTFIAAPAVDLTRLLAPGPERRYDAYLRLEIAADSARDADVYVVQAQGSEGNVERYRRFVVAAALQARAANPSVLVIAGISTNPSGLRVSAETILRAIDATRAAVDGYWFNVPRPGPYSPGCTEYRPDLALEVFHRLAKSD